MNTMMIKVAGLALLVAGEALSVYSEMIAAQSYGRGGAAFLRIFSTNSVLIAIAGAMLITGYMVSYAAVRNIWVVSVVSMTSILIVEPGLTYFVFRELPGRGPLLGLGFGVVGFLVSVLG